MDAHEYFPIYIYWFFHIFNHEAWNGNTVRTHFGPLDSSNANEAELFIFLLVVRVASVGGF